MSSEEPVQRAEAVRSTHSDPTVERHHRDGSELTLDEQEHSHSVYSADDVAEQLAASRVRAEELASMLVQLSRRVVGLGRALAHTNEQLRERDERLEDLDEELARTHDLLCALQDEGVQEQQAHAEALRVRDEEILRLRVRLQRIQESLPGRFYYRMRSLPLVRGFVATRTAGYESELRRARKESA